MEYVAGLKRAIKNPSGGTRGLVWKKTVATAQINSNVLQIEMKLYAPIRPKRVTRGGGRRLLTRFCVVVLIY